MQSAQRSETLGANRKQRRAAIACTACRQSKIKCSGDDPCFNCRRKSLSCRFAEGNNRILVSERYLRNLQKQAHNWQRATGVKRPQERSSQDKPDGIDKGQAIDEIGTGEELLGHRPGKPFESPGIESSCHIWTSPFTLPTTIFIGTNHQQRHWIWLAPASPWSLTNRLIVMMTEKFDLSSAQNPPQFYLDGDIYPLSWNQNSAVSSPQNIEFTDLPSLDYVLYLFKIVQFRLGRAYRFLDETTFIGYLHRIYGTRTYPTATDPLFCFVQFLMVLALGSAFTSRNRNLKEPPGSKYFVRAMNIMPTHISTGKDSLFAIEALALVGSYLYAIDHREAAHVHVGHAIRIAQLEGMHTQLPEEDLGAATVARCRNLWWSLYMMDSHFSPSLGLPMTLQDSDITTMMNSPTSSPQNLAFSLQVRLTRMSSFIISTIYKTEKTQLATFLDITRSILEAMAKYAEEIEDMFNINFHGSGDNVPEEIRHTILLYHQCIIIATRPLLLSVLKERLEKLGREEEDWQKFLTLPKSLISIGIKSAEKTLQIIGSENGIIETFLPFDHEMTYSAAVHLTMAKALFPSSTQDRLYSTNAHAILDELILWGNRVATARKQELSRIEELFQKLAERVEQEGLQLLNLADDSFAESNLTNVCSNIPADSIPGVSVQVTRPISLAPFQGQNVMPTPTDSSAPGSLDFLENIGISSYEFHSIINQINHPEFPCGDLDARSDWLSQGEDAYSFS